LADFRRRRRFGFMSMSAFLPLPLRPPAFFLALLMIKTSWLFQFSFPDVDAFVAVLRLSRCVDSRRSTLNRNFARFAKRKKRARAANNHARAGSRCDRRADVARLAVQQNIMRVWR
jgi:hypothetical protein